MVSPSERFRRINAARNQWYTELFNRQACDLQLLVVNTCPQQGFEIAKQHTKWPLHNAQKHPCLLIGPSA